MSDNFTRDKFVWLDQVNADPEVTPLAFRVAYVIASHLNRKTGSAWPSIATIAARVHKSPRSTQDTVTNLIKRGHLRHRRGGDGAPSTYWPVLSDQKKPAHKDPGRHEENFPSADDQIGASLQADKKKSAFQMRKNLHSDEKKTSHKPYDEPYERNPTRDHPPPTPSRGTVCDPMTPSPYDLDKAQLLWNETAKKNYFIAIERLTKSRRKALEQCLGEIGGLSGWQRMLSIISRSDFLRGEGPAGWNVTFDWAVNPNNAIKILEGNFGGD